MGLKGFKPTFYNPNYLVNKKGEVFSLHTQKVLKPLEEDTKYQRVYLGDKRYLIHRIVLQTFNPIKNHNKKQVNHINGKRNDNRLSNLEWATHRYNHNHKMKKKKYGIKAYMYKGKEYYNVTIYKNTKRHYLGTFTTKDAAYNAFYNKYLKLHGVAPWKNQ